MIAFVNSFSHGYEGVSQILLKLPINWTIVAQTFKQTDLVGDVQKAFDHFVQTGQIWAMITGLIIGYLFRSLTTY
ncbi:hypothetical protein [Synechocystis sp. PCC 7509]|uniref:hypothetical protein n=1 Tax=Synechocystis sp. PCC 7509 TaxID=927677 RepID=UPI0002ABB200|nr:hypothetical protein [Synechocystis sp. PCC 7509]